MKQLDNQHHLLSNHAKHELVSTNKVVINLFLESSCNLIHRTKESGGTRLARASQPPGMRKPSKPQDSGRTSYNNPWVKRGFHSFQRFQRISKLYDRKSEKDILAAHVQDSLHEFPGDFAAPGKAALCVPIEMMNDFASILWPKYSEVVWIRFSLNVHWMLVPPLPVVLRCIDCRFLGRCLRLCGPVSKKVIPENLTKQTLFCGRGLWKIEQKATWVHPGLNLLV